MDTQQIRSTIESMVRSFLEGQVEEIVGNRIEEKVAEAVDSRIEEKVEEEMEDVPSHDDTPTYNEVTNLIEVKATSKDDVREILEEEGGGGNTDRIMETVDERLQEFRENLPVIVKQTVNDLFNSLGDTIAGATEPHTTDPTSGTTLTFDEMMVTYAIEEIYDGEGDTEITVAEIESLIGPVSDNMIDDTISKLRSEGWIEETEDGTYELTQTLPEEARKEAEKRANPV